jgi:NitT/TauT family transport system substrate-binding protein
MHRLRALTLGVALGSLVLSACGGGAAPAPSTNAPAPPTGGARPATALATAGPTASAPTASAPLRKLLLPYSPVEASSTPLWLGVEERLFERYGLDVELQFVGGSSAILQAMTGGQFDLGGVGGGDVAPLRAAGGDVLLIAVYMAVFSQEGIVRPEIQRVADLRGKTLGVSRLGASSHFATIAMLASAGLRPEDATFIQTGGVGESMAALLSGNIDGAMLGFPQNLEAKRAGYRSLISFQELGDYGLFPQNAIAARESWLRDPANRTTALRFLRGLSDALALARAGGPEVRAAVRKYTKVDDDVVLQATVDFYREYFPDTLRVPEKSIANALQFVGMDHPDVRGLDPRSLYDNSLIDEVLRDMGR